MWYQNTTCNINNMSCSTADQINQRSYLILEAESSGTEETAGTHGNFELDDPLPTRESNNKQII